MKFLKENLANRILFAVAMIFLVVFSACKLSATVATTDLVAVTNAEVIAKSNTVEVNGFSYQNEKIVNNLVFHKKGDSITYRLTLKNNDEKDYTIKSIGDDNENNFIKFSFSDYEGKTLKANEEITIEMTEKYVAENNEIGNRSQVFSVNVVLSLQDETGDVIETVIPIDNPTSPQTGDKVVYYLAVIAVALFILILLIIKGSKDENGGKKYKIGAKFLSLVIIGVFAMPILSRAIVIKNVNLIIENNIDLKNKLVVVYNVDGEDKEVIVDYDDKVVGLEIPEKEGYKFNGWTLEDGTPLTSSLKITNDMRIVPNFEKLPENMVKYRIQYYLERLDSDGSGDLRNFEMIENIELADEKDKEVSAPVKSYYGFEYAEENENNNITDTVSEDGNTVLKVFYVRSSFTLDLTKDENIDTVTGANTYKYGTIVNIAATLKTEEGYTITFKEWETDCTTILLNQTAETSFAMPAENVTLKATSNKTPNMVDYKVEYYYQANGEYPTTADDSNIVTRQALTGTIAEVTDEDKVPSVDGYVYDTAAENVESNTVAGNGSTVLKAYFKQQFTVTYKPGTHGTFAEQKTENIDYNTNTPEFVGEKTHDAGYVFAGWDITVADKVTGTVEYTALWEADTVDYIVEYYYQVNGEYPETTENKTTRQALTESTVEVTNADKVPSVDGYVYDTAAENKESDTVAGDGSTTLKLYFKQQFTVTYKPGTHGTFAEQKTENLDYNVNTPEFIGEKTHDDGYVFAGWDKTVDNKVTKSEEYTAIWEEEQVDYTVEYYYQQNGAYSSTTENKTTRQALTGATVEVTEEDKVPSVDGYVYDTAAENVESNTVAGNGSTVLKLYFKQQFTVTYKPGTHGTFAEQKTESLDYNANTPEFSGEKTHDVGYVFAGWDITVADKVTGTVEYTALWEADTVDYIVEYYYQVNGEYPETTENKTTRQALTDSTAEVTDADKTPTVTGYVFDTAAANVESSTVAGDGSTVLKLYFKQQFTVTYKPGTHGTFETQTIGNIDYNANTPEFVGELTHDAGYAFAGWDITVADKVTANAEYTATWSEGAVDYTVEYYYQHNGEYPTTTDNKVTRQGVTGTTVEVTNADKTPSTDGYAYDTAAANIESSAVAGNGSTVLKLYFKQQFTVTYKPGNHGAFEVQTIGNLDYNANTPAFEGEKTPNAGYTFAGWDKEVVEKVTENTEYTATWTANEITFAGATLANGTYGTAYTSETFASANNGTGTYTYEVKSGAPTGASVDGENGANRMIKFPSTTPAGTYNVVVEATDVETGKKAEATFEITINKQTVSPVTDLAVSTTGIVTWTNSDNATGYEISFDGVIYSEATNGGDYLSSITETTGAKNVYVMATNSDTTNYESTATSIATTTVTVYSVTLTKGTGIEEVAGSGNYINGAIVSIAASVENGYAWTNWTNSSNGEIVKNERVCNIIVDKNYELTANASVNTYAVTFDANGGKIDVSGNPEDSIDKTYTQGQTYGELPTATKTGYGLQGWSLRNPSEILPDEYQEVEYLQSSGTEYINTNYVPNLNTKIELDYQFLTEGLTGQSQVGCGLASDTKRFCIGYIPNNTYFIFGIGKNYITNHVLDFDRHMFTIDMVNKTYGIDEQNNSFSINSFDNELSFVLFMRQDEPNQYLFGGTSKLYSFKVWDNNTLVRDMVPCYRKSDNVAGLYDRANGVFYTNDGTGTFTTGANVNYMINSSDIIKNENHTLYAIWTANELNFTGATLTNGTYGTAYTSEAFTGASNGAGTYTYTIKSGAPEGATIDSTNRTITFTNTTAAETYNVVVEAEDTVTGAKKEATFVITINKQQVSPVTNLAVATDGTISWTNSGNATGYEIIFDGTTYTEATNGGDYLSTLTGTTGSKTVYVKAINSDTTNYETVAESIASTTTSVYSVTLTAGTGIETVTGAGNYITGATVTLGATVSTNYAWTKWTNTSTGDDISETNAYEFVVSENCAYTANAVENVINVPVTLDANGGTYELNNEQVGTSTRTYEIGSTYGELPTPTREGYKFIGWKDTINELPSEYQEVEYVRFNGDQYIDTGYVPSNHMTTVKFDFEEYNNNEHLFGTNSGADYYHFTEYSDKYYWGLDGYEANAGPWTTGTHVLEMNGNNNSVKLDGTLIGEGSNITTSSSLLIGDRAGAGIRLKGIVYYLTIKDKISNNIVRNFVPCYRKSDNVIGFYDTVRGVFYENDGTGEFGKGRNVGNSINSDTTLVVNDEHTIYAIWERKPTVTFNANGGTYEINNEQVNTSSKQYEINDTYGELPTPTREGYTFDSWRTSRLPVGYQEVEYVQFNGNQSINTELIPSNHKLEAKFDLGEYDGGDLLFQTSRSEESWKYFHFTSYYNGYCWGENGYERIASDIWTAGVHELVYNGDNNIVILDGETLDSGNEISASDPLWIGTGFAVGANNLTGKIYNIKITNKTTGEVERDFIPCYSVITNEIGFYDIVNDVFYTNQGKGTFTKGNDVNIVINSDTTIVNENDYTVYAIWRKNITVTFDANGGNVSIPSKAALGYSTYGELPTPTKEDNTFIAWATRTYRVPDEYQEVEYVQFNGEQSINTELIPSNHKLETKFDFEDYDDGEYFFQTARSEECWKYFHFTAYYNGYCWGENGSEHIEYDIWTTGTHELIYNGDNNIVSIDGETLGSGENITADAPLLIGTGIAAGPHNLKGKIYYIRITNKETGEVERDLIPCYRKSDNVIGFYDIANDVFYVNSGTGEFGKGKNHNSDVNLSKYAVKSESIAINEDHTLHAIWKEPLSITLDANGGTYELNGEQVSTSTRTYEVGSTIGELPTPTRDGYKFIGWSTNTLPEEYQEVEYVESNGEQEINTHINPTEDIGFKVKFSVTTMNENPSPVSCQDSPTNMYGIIIGTDDENREIGSGNGSVYDGWTGVYATTNTIYDIEYDYLNSSVVNIDGEDVVTLNNGRVIPSSKEIRLFNGTASYNTHLIGRIYEVTITDGSEVIRHYVPCYRKEDGIIGLYDTVGNAFYTNEGTGTFEKGEDVEDSITPSSTIESIENITVYAKWRKNVNVTFDANGGKIDVDGEKKDTITREYEYGSEYGELPTPERAGYTLLGWKRDDLPEEYQQVEFIRFTGDQYIDTGVVPSNHMTTVKFDFEEYNNEEHLFGTNSDAQYYHFTAYSNKYYWGLYGSEANVGPWTTGAHVLEMNGDNYSVKLDGTVIGEGSYITSSTNLLIGDRSGGGIRLRGTIYYFIIRDKNSNSIVRNFIPCYRKSDDVIGFYDTVTNTFYTNNGTGTFEKGNDVNVFYTATDVVDKKNDHTLYAIWKEYPQITLDANGGTYELNGETVNTSTRACAPDSVYGELPTPTKEGYGFVGWSNSNFRNEYQEVEYIKSTGTQYIDTGYYANPNTKIELEAMATYTTDTNGYSQITGARNSYHSKSALQVAYELGGNNVIIDYGTTEAGRKTVNKNTKFRVEIANNSCAIDDSVYTPSGVFDETSTYPLWIFDDNKEGAHEKYFIGKLYSYKIYENDVLVRDFVPCYRKADSVVGLYDKVNDVFYTNQGTGEFIKGDDVDNYSNDDKYVTSSTTLVSDEDHTLYAIWKEPLSITLDANGGTYELNGEMVNTSTRTYVPDSIYGELPTPTKANYQFMGWSKKDYVLPNEYQEVEYIHFNGNQFIDTGVSATSNITTEVKYDFETYENCEYLFGTSRGYAYYNFTAYDHTYYIGGNNADNHAGTWSSGVHVLIYNGANNSVKLDDDILVENIEFDSGANLLVGEREGNGRRLNGKIYYFKLIDKTTGEVVSYLIPCYRKSDDVIGLYDVVTGIFHAKAGFEKGNDVDNTNSSVTSESTLVTNTNHTLYAVWRKVTNVTFDANGGTIDMNGEAVNRVTKAYEAPSTYGDMPTPTKANYQFMGWSMLPAEYQEVEYIHFNGDQFINTGVSATSNITTEVKYDFEDPYENCEYLFGTSRGYAYYNFTAFNNTYYIGGNNADNHAGTWSSGVHVLIYNGANNSVKLDDDILAENIEFDSGANLLIGEREGNGRRLNGKIYYFKLIDKTTGEVVRNLIPCYRKSDDVIGLYDTVTGTFYTNDGTGTFGKGNDADGITSLITSEIPLNTNANHILYAMWEKQEITGESIVPTQHYGQKVNYSITVKGKVLNNWDLFLKDDDGYAYLIYGDYLPTAVIPEEVKTAGKLVTDGTYRIWDSYLVDDLKNALTTTEYWNQLISSDLQTSAENAGGTATATGGATETQFKDSWNGKYTEAEQQITATVDEDLSTKTGYGDIMYFPHDEEVADGTYNCDGYWLSSDGRIYDLKCIEYNGTINSEQYDSKNIAIRPIIRIPASILIANDDQVTWDIKDVVYNDDVEHIVPKVNYGQKVNYSVTVAEHTLDNWKLFMKDDNGYAYMIYGDYLPNDCISQDAISNGRLVRKGDYRVYTSDRRDTLINTLKNVDYWSNLVTSELNQAAQDVSGTASATGGATVAQLKKSWNEKYTELGQQMETSGSDTTAWDSENLSTTTGYSVDESDNMYFPHKSDIGDGSSCRGYWLASIHDGYGLKILLCDGRLNGDDYDRTYVALRPLIRIPEVLLEYDETSEEWNINYGD